VDAAAPVLFRIAGIDNLMHLGLEGNRLWLSKLGVTVIHGDIHSASDLAARRDFGWKIGTPAADLFEEIAQYTENNTDWLERSLV
jgi:hypothetical protein